MFFAINKNSRFTASFFAGAINRRIDPFEIDPSVKFKFARLALHGVTEKDRRAIDIRSHGEFNGDMKYMTRDYITTAKSVSCLRISIAIRCCADCARFRVLPEIIRAASAT